MNKKAADKSTTDSNNKGDKSAEKRLFYVSALNMSWQLALVVLIPIVGGYELDQRLATLPAFTVIGFVIAMICSGIVIKRQLQAVMPEQPDSNGGKK